MHSGSTVTGNGIDYYYYILNTFLQGICNYMTEKIIIQGNVVFQLSGG